MKIWISLRSEALTSQKLKITCIWTGEACLFFGKMLAAGDSAVCAVVFCELIKEWSKVGQGEFKHMTTYQAHSLSVVASLRVQKILEQQPFLEDMNEFC